MKPGNDNEDHLREAILTGVIEVDTMAVMNLINKHEALIRTLQWAVPTIGFGMFIIGFSIGFWYRGLP